MCSVLAGLASWVLGLSTLTVILLAQLCLPWSFLLRKLEPAWSLCGLTWDVRVMLA